MTIKPAPLSVLLAMLALSACSESKPPDEAKMLKLSSHLLQLSKAVYSTTRYKSPPAGIEGKELLALSTKHDPSLLKPFDDYLLKVLHKGKDAAILVCTKDGAVGLLEDTECTPGKLDQYFKPAASCSFTLDLGSLCSP